MSKRRVVLWRHGQTAWNLESRFQGRTDIPLDAKGVAQSEEAAARLAALRPTAILSSPLQRATRTAAALAEVTGLSIALDPDLIERGGGVWEGLTSSEIRARFPAEYGRWEAPNGESSAEVAKRVATALERAIAQMPDDGPLVVVSHGAALRLGLANLLGLPEEFWDRLGGLSNCNWSVVAEMRNGGWRLVEHNAGSLPEPVLSDDKAAGDT
jgi:glucosyl-3-phosphoglycerate phosphatase